MFGVRHTDRVLPGRDGHALLQLWEGAGAVTFTIAQADALGFLRLLPAECVDLVVTDPAYESLEKHRAIGTTTRLKSAWFPIFPNSRFPELFRELYRVMKPDTHLYVFTDDETMFIAKPIGEAAGFKFWKPLPWNKVAMGMGYHYRAMHEQVLFFEKGARQLNDLGVPDVLTFKRVRGGYPTEKPLELLELLVSQSSHAGELVLDPFLGSGVTGHAALHLNGPRRFIGCDVEQHAVDGARARLLAAGGLEQLELPRGQPSLL